MNQKVINHFKKVDSKLFKLISLISKIEDLKKLEQSEYFISLCDQIISQQLSGKVAIVIFKRFLNLFPNQRPTPELIIKISNENLRKVGMSNSKVSFLKDLADKTLSKELVLDDLDLLTDEEIKARLIKVKGIGPWTAEMFLMFTLGREDVFSAGDLGLKNAIKKIYQNNNLTEKNIIEISEKWKPYRTSACRILWRSLEI